MKILKKTLVERLETRLLCAITTVLQNHNDSNSTGDYLNETLLTEANVSAGNFGRIFDTALDGQVYAQPLAVPNVNITRGSSLGVHNVMFVATIHDSLFAIDAVTGQILWQDSFLQIANPEVAAILSPVPTDGVTTVPAVTGDDAIVDTSNVGPEMGTIATPVINPATNVIYQVTYTQERRNGTNPSATGSDFHYVERLWAVNLADGSVAIAPTNSPSIEPASGGLVIADTVLDPTGASTVPTFNAYTNYIFDVGPFIKGTGNNAPTVNSTTPGDGWTGSAPTSFFAGKTPQSQGCIAFNALTQMGRVSLSLINNVVYLGYASHGDNGPYYGWILGYNATTLANTAVFVSDPTYEPFSIVTGDDSQYDGQGGFWGAGTAFTTDGTYIYASTGNGAFNPSTSNFNSNYFSMDGSHKVQMPIDGDFGDSVLKIQIDPSANQNGSPSSTTYNPDSFDQNGFGLKVVDYFVPSNVYELNKADADLGSGGVLMIPTTGTGAMTAPDGDAMLVTGGKEGRIYLLDAGNLGGFSTAYDPFQTTNNDPSPYDRVLGEYYYYGAHNAGTFANNATDKIYATSAYLNGVIYLGIGGNASNGNYLPEIAIPVSSLLAGTSPPGTATSAAISSFTGNNFGGRGTSPTISADGSSNGIVWGVVSSLASTDSLMAYNASNLAQTLFNSNTNLTRDSLTNSGVFPGTRTTGATAAKFNIATAFDGMVYDGTGGGSGVSGHAAGTFVGYGLLPALVQSGTNFAAPTLLAATITSQTNIHLAWTDNSTDEVEFEIQRSADNGNTWSTLVYVQHGVNLYDDGSISAGQSYQYRVRGISGGTMTQPGTGTATPAITTSFTNTATIGTFPTWLAANSQATYNTAGHTLAITGVATIIADPGADSPIITATGNAAQLSITPASSTQLHITSLNISGGAIVTLPGNSTTPIILLMSGSNLTIDSTSTLDIGNNVVDIPGGNLPGVSNLVKRGFDSLWSGTGITSSTAASDATHLTAVGAILNSTSINTPIITSIDGATLHSTDVLVKFTYFGDANLSGNVDGDDYSRIDSAFVQGGFTGWANGDFNYDGYVDGSDYTLIDNAFNAQRSPLANPASAIATAMFSLVGSTGEIPKDVVSKAFISSSELTDSSDDFTQKHFKPRQIRDLLAELRRNH